MKAAMISWKPLILYNHSTDAKGMVNERGSNRIFPAHGFSAAAPISPVCGALRRRLQDSKLHLSGPVPLLGLRAAYFPGRSPRHRSLSAGPPTQALSHGLSGTGFAQQPSLRQRPSRLADLRRLCAGSDCPRPRPLPRRTFRGGLVRDRLRLRLDDHRFVSLPVPLGPVSPSQERRQTAHPAGPAGQHSHQCLCDRRTGPRCQRARRTATETRSFLRDGSRLCGFRSPLSVHSSLRLSSSPAPRRTCSSIFAPRVRWTERRACAATKPFA